MSFVVGWEGISLSSPPLPLSLSLSLSLPLSSFVNLSKIVFPLVLVRKCATGCGIYLYDDAKASRTISLLIG